MDIVTNNQPRQIIDGFELTAKERAQFDYLEDIESASFFRYRGAVYDLGEFMRSDSYPGWHGVHCDTTFSGVLVRISSDGESVTVARVYA